MTSAIIWDEAKMEAIRARFTAEEWTALGGLDRETCQRAMDDGMSAAQIGRDRAWTRSVIAAIAVSACLLALLITTDPMAHFVEYMQTEAAR